MTRQPLQESERKTMTPNKERCEFLHGLRTLTAAELREWAAELYPFAAPPALPAGMSEDEPLMVSVVPDRARHPKETP